MNDTSRRQIYLLAGLVALLAVIVVLRMRGGASATGTPQAGTAARPSNQAAAAGGRQDAPVVDVKLDALRQSTEAMPGSDRNPFRFEQKAAPAPRPVPAASRPPQQAYVPPVPQGPPPPPPIPLRYIGVLGSSTQPDRVAVLSDARGNPIYGKEGDIIEGRYRVLRIAGDSVDVAYADGRGRQTLRLSAQ